MKKISTTITMDYSKLNLGLDTEKLTELVQNVVRATFDWYQRIEIKEVRLDGI